LGNVLVGRRVAGPPAGPPAPPPPQQGRCGASVTWPPPPRLTHSLRGQHVVDGVVVLLGQDGQLAGLLVLQALQHGLVVRLGRVLQQVVAQRLVLAGLDLTGVLELTLNLQLFGLEERREGGSWAKVLLWSYT